MPLRTFDSDDAPLPLREELTYSRDRCENHDLGAQHVAVFAALLDEWQVVFAKFLALQDKIARAEARVDASDDELDPFVDEVAAALLLGNNDRNAPEFRAYFGSKQPHEVRRPVLGEELELVRAWIPALKASGNALLANLGTRGEALVAKADGAVEALGAAKQEFRSFRLAGEYSQFVDKLNASRKAVYGELGKAAHAPEAKGLPGDFPDHFFRHEARRNKKQTPQAVRDRIAALEAELTRQKVSLGELDAKAAADAQAEEARKALEAELVEAERARAELEKKTAEIKARLKK
jgi:hypothetical protein